MRILHVQETMSPRFGGPVEVVAKLAQGQHDAGHDVEIATTNSDHPHGSLCSPGWGVLPHGTVKAFYGETHFPLRFSQGLATFLRKSIRTFDVVHIHGLYRFPPTYAAYQARKQSVPYIITPHGALDPYIHARSSRGVWLKRIYERMFDLPNLNAASGIHYSTDAERDNAAFLGLSAPTFVVPNGLDWNRFRVLPARGGFRQKWVPENASVMLFVGRIHPVKGLDTLILAFAEIYAKHPNARLVIVGPENDDYGNHLRSRIREIGLDAAIVFTGPLIGVELVQAYVDADIFVLPSHTENFGMVVAEAMASAMPVVISDQVKVSADVANAGAGIVTRRNVADLAEALEGLLSNESKRSAMGNAGRRLVHEKYRLPEVLRAFFLEYAKAIDGNSNRAKP